jgi:ATP-dependent helicase YprA (DUF1998 family)
VILCIRVWKTAILARTMSTIAMVKADAGEAQSSAAAKRQPLLGFEEASFIDFLRRVERIQRMTIKLDIAGNLLWKHASMQSEIPQTSGRQIA